MIAKSKQNLEQSIGSSFRTLMFLSIKYDKYQALKMSRTEIGW